ncbi:hypothetical protein AMJ85_07800 [candidate division BRC1 bacterium SM23_51]|nr:MAG: hypothetical protein AMJ85_07800 [candidate division BRC1 bacterium SM23_51]
MTDTATKKITNRGFCEHCHTIVPLRHQAREGKMYLVKDCPNCGTVETMVSSDAERYMEKRRLCEYEGEAQATCHLNCVDCNHGFTPKLVHLDVTNRCNMNCPICAANVQAMGFDFNPPMEYFEKIFKELAKYDPKPRVQFFGGEPTVRDDFIEIVRLARKYRLPARVATNGIRLADEQYCKELLDTRVHLLFAFDGRHPDIYKKMRKSPRALELKLKALDNVKNYNVRPGSGEFSSRRITILSAVGLGINDKHMDDFFQFCHERREQISVVAIIPLQVTPGPEQVAPQSTSIEDVERICADAIPGVEFIPTAMLQMFETIQETFDVRITFGGTHPNCETVTILIADEERYRPVSDYLKTSFGELVESVIAWDRRMGEKLKGSWIARLFGKRGRQLVVGWGLVRLAPRYIRIGKFIGPNPIRNLARMVWRKVTTGKQWKKLIRRYSGVRGVMRLIILPYEDEGWLETARLMTCPVAFVYEHPKTRKVELMPFCSWLVYKNDILRATAEHYSQPSKAAQEKVEVG